MYLAKITTNTFYQFIGKFFSSLGFFYITFLISRNWDNPSFVLGEFSLVFINIAILFTISDFGSSSFFPKIFLGKDSVIKNSFLGVLVLRLSLAFTFIFLHFVFLQFSNYPPHIISLIKIGYLTVIFYSVYSSFLIVAQSKENYLPVALSQGISFILLFALSSFSAVFLNLSLLIFIYFASFGVSALFLTFYFNKFVNLKAPILIPSSYLLAILPLGTSLFFSTLMNSADRIMLSLINPHSAINSLGIYSLSYKIFEIILLVPFFITNSIYPSLINTYQISKTEFKLSLLKLIKVMILLWFLICILTTVFGYFAISTIWGKDMLASFYPLVILAIGSLAFFISLPLYFTSVIIGKQNKLPLIYFAGMIINVLLNLIFIPKFSYIACAFVTIITEVIIALLLFLNNYSSLKE